VVEKQLDETAQDVREHRAEWRADKAERQEEKAERQEKEKIDETRRQEKELTETIAAGETVYKKQQLTLHSP